MPTCSICEGDGVLEALGRWYCIEHLEDGFIDVAVFLARARGWDTDEVSDLLWDWLDE